MIIELSRCDEMLDDFVETPLSTSFYLYHIEDKNKLLHLADTKHRVWSHLKQDEQIDTNEFIKREYGRGYRVSKLQTSNTRSPEYIKTGLLKPHELKSPPLPY